VQPFAIEPLVAAYIGLVLLFALLCASYGVLRLVADRQQVLAGFLTALPLLMLWLLAWNERERGRDAAVGARAVDLQPFEPFSVGLIELRDVFYFLFASAIFVWATLRVLEARQWLGRR
jgi:ABC-2 type transport system permease protein